ncbi:MAG: MBL fold metallo-hydrolase [Cyclobacteriaceae bacterium]|nr:MBL fold metallo-hydrolase [Cyclobacteriaceae bacterium]
MELIKAFQKGEELLNDIRNAPVDEKGFHIWWLGQSGFLIKWKNFHLLFDPYLSDSLTKKYAETDKPHVRMGEQVIRPEQLDFIDVVTSSHNHTDHLDAETILPLLEVNPHIKLLIPEANRAFVANRLNCDESMPIGLVQGAQTTIGPFTFHGVPAAHNSLDKNEKGQCLYMGFVVQFGSWSLYHSGDTLKYEGMEEILAAFKPDIVFLPINGNRPERRVAGNLNPEESAKLAKAIGAGKVIPHHYHMFSFNTEDPDKFVGACKAAGQEHVVLKLGQRFSFGV